MTPVSIANGGPGVEEIIRQYEWVCAQRDKGHDRSSVLFWGEWFTRQKGPSDPMKFETYMASRQRLLETLVKIAFRDMDATDDGGFTLPSSPEEFFANNGPNQPANGSEPFGDIPTNPKDAIE